MYLRLHQNYTILDLINHKLSNQRMKFFTILQKIDKLAFRLQLSSMIRIHSMISIAQLELVVLDIDSYERTLDMKSSSIKKVNSNQEALFYKLERIFVKRIARDQIYYLIKWKRYDNEHNVWYSMRVLNEVKNLIANYEIRESKQSSISTRRWIVRTSRLRSSIAKILSSIVATRQLDIEIQISSLSQASSSFLRRQSSRRSLRSLRYQ